ncbi:hypothetical protein HDU96_009973 [Phlyctochytrium bullatum]|nr:hypothetical protein HDU96_009973 [Phlyctochytrium bullatum]
MQTSRLNRHLRSAVAGCIDRKLAEHHISQTSKRIIYLFARSAPAATAAPEENMLHRIPFKHPLLRFHHTVAALCRHGIDSSSADQIWGDYWSSSRKQEAIFFDQVRALRAAVRERFRQTKPGKLSNDEIDDLERAITAAQSTESLELLTESLGVMSKVVLEVPEDRVVQNFFVWSAEMGSTEGLALVPVHHPMLSDDITWPLRLFRITIENKHLPAIRLLLEKGAVVSDRTTAYLHPGDDPANLEILALLLQHGFDPNWYFHDEDRFSFDALVKNSSHDFVKLLLEHGGDANARDAKGFTPQCKNMPLFLDAGADINAIGGGGHTALGIACGMANTEAIQILLDRGAALNVSCEWPPVHAAAKSGTPDPVELLLDAGAQVNFRASNGETALHTLLKSPRPLLDRGTTVLLLEAGAELDETGADGKTAWKKLCAAALRDGRLLRWALERGGLRRDKIEEAALIQE